MRFLALTDTFDREVTFGAGGDGLDGEVIGVGSQHKVSPLVVGIAALPLPVGQRHTFLPCEHLQVRPVHSCLQGHLQAQCRVRGNIRVPAEGLAGGALKPGSHDRTPYTLDRLRSRRKRAQVLELAHCHPLLGKMQEK